MPKDGLLRVGSLASTFPAFRKSSQLLSIFSIEIAYDVGDGFGREALHRIMLAVDHLGFFDACDKVGISESISGRGKVGHDKLSVLVTVLDLKAVKFVNR